MKKLLTLLALLGIFFTSCSNDDNNPIDPGPSEPTPTNYSSGSADFSTYVALGNSLTAGYSDGALFIDGQTASYPNMLATSFAEAGGGSFSQPLMADNLGSLTLGGSLLPGFENRYILSFANVDPNDPNSTPSPVRLEGTGATEVSNILSGPFNNMGVPGAKIYHLGAEGYGSLDALAIGAANPYYVRFASSPTASILGDAVAQNPTFFSLWIGSNDILSFAISGGEGVDRTGDMNAAAYGPNDITDPGLFQIIYEQLLQALTANGASGIVANLVDVTKVPYFTTVPYAPLNPTDPDFGPQIPVLNATFSQLNQVFTFLGVPERAIQFSADSASALVVKDESLTDLSAQITNALMAFGVDSGTAGVVGFLYGQARQANENDLVVLPARNEIGEVNETAFATLQGLGLPATDAGQLSVNGITYPLEDKWVLTPEEQAMIVAATDKYNTSISSLAQQYDLALVDINSLLNAVSTEGLILNDGSTVTAQFAVGGAFSLDGIHLSPRGYAIVANQFIEAIENEYGAELPKIEPLQYTGLYIN